MFQNEENLKKKRNYTIQKNINRTYSTIYAFM